MKTMTLGLLLALLAAPLMAGEKEEANTKAFLDGATAIKDSALGKDELHLVMLGISVGKMTIEVTKGEVGGKPAYLVTANAVFEVGAKNELNMKSAFAPNLALISQEETESEDGKVVKTKKFTTADGACTIEITNTKAKTDDEKNRKHEVKLLPNLLLGSAGMLVGRLLPAEAKAYAFKTWDSDSAEVYDATVEVSVDKDVVTVKQTGLEADRDAEGNLTTEEKTTTGWLKAGKIIKLDLGKGPVLTSEAPAARTPITDEMMSKLDKEVLAPALFFRAFMSRDEEKIKQAVNLDRIFDNYIESIPELAALTPEQKAAAKAMQLPTLARDMLGKEEEKSEAEKREEAFRFKLLLHVENFVVEKGEGEQMKVTFTDEAKAMFGATVFTVEKFDGKWQIVWIDNKKADGAEEGK